MEAYGKYENTNKGKTENNTNKEETKDASVKENTVTCNTKGKENIVDTDKAANTNNKQAGSNNPNKLISAVLNSEKSKSQNKSQQPKIKSPANNKSPSKNKVENRKSSDKGSKLNDDSNGNAETSQGNVNSVDAPQKQRFQDALSKLRIGSQVKMYQVGSEDARNSWDLKRKHSPEEDIQKNKKLGQGQGESQGQIKDRTSDQNAVSGENEEGSDRSGSNGVTKMQTSLPGYMSARTKRKSSQMPAAHTGLYKLDPSVLDGGLLNAGSGDGIGPIASPINANPEGKIVSARRNSQKAELSTKKVELRIPSK